MSRKFACGPRLPAVVSISLSAMMMRPLDAPPSELCFYLLPFLDQKQLTTATDKCQKSDNSFLKLSVCLSVFLSVCPSLMGLAGSIYALCPFKSGLMTGSHPDGTTKVGRWWDTNRHPEGVNVHSRWGHFRHGERRRANTPTTFIMVSSWCPSLHPHWVISTQTFYVFLATWD